MTYMDGSGSICLFSGPPSTIRSANFCRLKSLPTIENLPLHDSPDKLAALKDTTKPAALEDRNPDSSILVNGTFMQNEVLIKSEIEAKFIQNRIQSVEKHILELSNTFSQYSRKASRLRDKNEEISKTISNYAETESVNKSLSSGLESFADSIQLLNDYGDKRVQNLETKVVTELSKYKDVCKHAKDEVKEIYSAREKELTRKKQLYKIKEKNPRNRQQIIQAETELVKATAKVSKSIHNLEEKTTAFEKQKIHDIKSVLLDFIAIELAYHVKSMETLTDAYDKIEGIDEKSDLEEFKKTLRLSDLELPQSPKKSLKTKTGKKFGSLGAIFATNHSKENNRAKIKEKMTKSEESLDNSKQDLSEDDSEETQSNSDDNISISDDNITESPQVGRKQK